jgi:hypothetical protein
VLLLTVLAGAVAVVAAIRSTWSPCGQSMLSTITPLGEAARGNRFRTTAAWFIAGATLGGAVLGLGAALLALMIGLAGIEASTALGVGAVLAMLAAAADAHVFGLRVPYHRRQVNEYWLDDYRSWVYGAGFGFQIGLGVATYIMTSAVVLLVALGALTGEPLAALAIGTLFGLVRGLGVLPGARLTTPAALAAFHAEFDARSEWSRRLVIVTQVVVAVVASGAVWGVLGGAAVAAGALLVVAQRRRGRFGAVISAGSARQSAPSTST